MSWVEALVQSYGGFWPWSLRTHPPPTEKCVSGGQGAQGATLGRISAKKTPPKVKNGYETSWVEALVQSYGGFWPWSLRIHPPPPKKCVLGGQGGGAAFWALSGACTKNLFYSLF